MRNFFTVFIAIILAIAVVGAVAVLFTPKEPDETTNTDSDTNTGTNTDNNDLIPDNEQVQTPTIEIEDVEELITALETLEDGAVIAIPASIELTETVAIGNKEVTFIFSEDYDKPVSVELQEGKLTIMNGHFNGIDISGKGTVILDNVMSQATEEGDSGLSLQDGADVTIKIVGSVSLLGAKNGDGLEVPYGTKLLLTGDTLVAVGNNGVEYTGIDAYNTTDDETYMNMRGSGIGDAVHNIGSLTIKDMTSLTAKGYGNKAFGIG